MRLVLTDAMVFVAGQYIMIYAVNHGLPLVWKWYQVTNHFTKPLRTSYTSSEDAKIARSLEAKRKRKLCCCRQGYRLQKRSVSVRPQSLAELWHRRGTWWVHSTQSQWWMLIKEIKPESDSDSSSDEEELVAVDDDDDDDDADSPKSKHWRGRSILGDLAKRKHDVEERLEAEQAEPALEGEEYADESEVHILDWGSGKEMQVLTKLPKSHLRVFSQLLADAGLDTRNKIIDSNKSPEELRRMIEKQTGKHRYKYDNPTAVKVVAKARKEREMKAQPAAGKHKQSPMRQSDQRENVKIRNPMMVAEDERPPLDVAQRLKGGSKAIVDIVASKIASPGGEDLAQLDPHEQVSWAEDAIASVSGTAQSAYRKAVLDTAVKAYEMAIKGILKPFAELQAHELEEHSPRLKGYKVRIQVLKGECAMMTVDAEKDWPTILREYGQALRLNEFDEKMQDKIAEIDEEFNQVSEKMRKSCKDKDGTVANPVRTFAEALVNCEGDWEEVTDLVDAQRLNRLTPQKFGSYQTARLMMDIIYRQMFVWVGSTWCPWLPLVASLLQMCMFFSLRHAFLGVGRLDAAYEGRSSWSADQIQGLFLSYTIVSILICAVPMLVWLNQEPTCGPHNSGAYNDENGNRVEGHGAKVYETVGVFLDYVATMQVDSTGEDNYMHAGTVASIGSFFVQPPVLLILILILFYRMRIVLEEHNTLSHYLAKKTAAMKKETEFLESQLREYHKKQPSTGGARNELQQSTKEHANRRQEEEDMDEIVSSMMGSKLGVTGASVSELQQLLEMTEQNEARLADLLSASTVWIANIEPEFCTEKYIKKRVTEESGSIVLACTLRKISKHDTAVLIEQDTKKHLPPPQWYHKSWALVTFVHPRSAEAKLLQFDHDPDNAPRGIFEGAWHAEMWYDANARVPRVPGLDGDLGHSEGGDSIVSRHNSKLRKQLERLIDSRTKARTKLLDLSSKKSHVGLSAEAFGEVENVGTRYYPRRW